MFIIVLCVNCHFHRAVAQIVKFKNIIKIFSIFFTDNRISICLSHIFIFNELNVLFDGKITIYNFIMFMTHCIAKSHLSYKEIAKNGASIFTQHIVADIQFMRIWLSAQETTLIHGEFMLWISICPMRNFYGVLHLKLYIFSQCSSSFPQG